MANPGSKKKKRTAEEIIFSESTGRPTDEALAVCRFLGIDPKNLAAKQVESFRKPGVN